MFNKKSLLGVKVRAEVVAALAAVTAAGFVSQPASAQFDQNDVIRLNNSNPIIQRSMFPSNRRNSDGNNIDGPSMVRIPSFVATRNRANSNARYYLYFGHHDGDYIRMAWSRNPDRGFTLYDASASVGDRGVLDNNNTNVNIDEGIQLRRNHFASPDVHIEGREFVMYFHHGGPYRFNGRDTNSQRTFVNTSGDGLEFRRGDILPVQLGPSYFKVFENRGRKYAVHNDGGPVRAPSNNNPFRAPGGYYNGNSLPSLWSGQSGRNALRDAVSDSRRVRHSGVLTSGNNLRLFYSIRGDSPERIFFSNMSLSNTNFSNWTVRIPGNEILRAVGGWEEGQRTPSPSVGGQQTNVNQLRDPDVFQDDDGSLYLYYSGAGEEAIGVAALQSSRQRITSRGATHDAETRLGNQSNRNFRSDSIMTIANGSGTSARRGYFRFPTPGSATVRAAVLRLYLPNNENGSMDVYGTSNFNEASITGNNQPRQTTARLDRVPLGFRGFYELDVTSYVNSQRNNNVRFFVRNTNSNGVQILTSENGNRSRVPGLKWMIRP